MYRKSSKKRIGVVHEGMSTIHDKSPNSGRCMVCVKVVETVVKCASCGCGRYCSRECMLNHVEHKKLCVAICSLEDEQRRKQMSNEIHGDDSEKLPYENETERN